MLVTRSLGPYCAGEKVSKKWTLSELPHITFLLLGYVVMCPNYLPQLCIPLPCSSSKSCLQPISVETCQFYIITISDSCNTIPTKPPGWRLAALARIVVQVIRYQRSGHCRTMAWGVGRRRRGNGLFAPFYAHSRHRTRTDVSTNPGMVEFSFWGTSSGFWT